MHNNRLLDMQYRAFRFFQDHTNLNPGSPGYGLTADSTAKPAVASIAATGFMLSSLVIGASQGYISRDAALLITRHTLETLLERVPHQFGFFAHYLDIARATRHRKCEYSTIDTALCLNGVITAASYFNDPVIHDFSDRLLARVEWQCLFHLRQGRPMLYMSYNPDKGGAYVTDEPGFIHQWDMFAEQLMMYVMIGASPHQHRAKALYEGFVREKGSYQDLSYLYSPGNALFVYQFPLAWFDLAGWVDADGVSWFDNTKNAILAHQALSVDLMDTYRTFSAYRFGFNASDTPLGYRVFSGLPNHHHTYETDGTVAPFGIVGALPFLPELAMSAIEDMAGIPGLYEQYGFMDAFNFEDGHWISNKIIAIDKGLEMLMVNAVLSKDVYRAYMRHPLIKKGMATLGWTRTSQKEK